MSSTDAANNANSLICALSGQSPILDPVVTPSGRICSKRLLLSKLVETNGRDPFTDAYLDESKLVDILVPFADASVVPPRMSGGNSLPSLLRSLQAEYDAVILELFDARKALEETRRELSMALYQNDAAVRVIARTLMERDAARAELSRWSSSSSPIPGGPLKRKRVDGTEDDNGGNGNVQPQDERETQHNLDEMQVDDSKISSNGIVATVIPNPELQLMIKKRDELSTYRRNLMKKVKQDVDTYATMETFNAWTSLQKKNWHKTSAKPGILALTGPLAANNNEDSIIVTHARDKQIIVYSTASESVVTTISFKPTLAFMEFFHDTTTGTNRICVIDANAVVSIFSGKVFETVATLSLSLTENDHIIGMAIHPTGKHIFLASSHGNIFMLTLAEDGSNLCLSTQTKDDTLANDNIEYSCIRLHPDGLLMAAGRTDGKICMWDLQAFKQASTFTGADHSSIAKLAFSENGFTMASASSNGNVVIWDLRKLEKVTLFKIPQKDGVDCKMGQATVLSFCPVGKHLAIGTSNGQVIIAPVKDMTQTKILNIGTGDEGNVSGILWGKNAHSLITCNDHERGVQFWGN